MLNKSWIDTIFGEPRDLFKRRAIFVQATEISLLVAFRSFDLTVE